MSRYKGINHLAMATGDMDQTIRFWRDLLGMRLVAGLGKPGMRHYFFEISENDLIAFFEWDGVEPAPEKDHGRPVKGPFIFDHLSIGVESEDHLWEIKDKLSAAGYPVSGVVNHGFIHSIYSWDPNGIPIEFSVNVPQVDVRANPLMTDIKPSEITKEGPDPQPGKWPQAGEPTPQEKRAVYDGVGHDIADPDLQTW